MIVMKNWLHTLLVVFCYLLCSQTVSGQILEDNSKWSFEAKKTSGNHYQIIFHLSLPDKWHIYSLHPGGDGMEIAPSFSINKNPNIKLIGAMKEKGKLRKETFPGIDGVVNNFHDKVDFIQEVEISGNTTVKGKYSYQICNESSCLPPTTKDFSVEVKDAGGESKSTESSSSSTTTVNDTNKSGGAEMNTANAGNVTDTTAKATTSTTDTASKALNAKAPADGKKPEEQSKLLLFLICFGGGLLAVITPCVFSMIPITVSFFTKRSKTRQEGIRNAIYYSLSIIIIFTVFGLLISAIWGREALYNISTNWILNIVFFILFVIFGISFLGAFEITLPSSWTNKTDSKAGLGSFSGIFFMALTLVIVSFSCTGPIVAMLFALSAEGGFLGPIIGMFAFSLGLSLPFALCAIFPAVINKLGKAGGWLNQVKVTLGFIELGLSLKFFSNADSMKQWRILDREIFIALWIVLAILLGMYLLGKIKLSHDDEPKKNVYGQEYVSIFKLFLAIASFTFALYLLPGMWGAPLNAVGSFVPSMGTQDFVLHNCDGNSSKGGGEAKLNADDPRPIKYASRMKQYEPNVVINNGLVTYFDYEEAIEASRKLKKPLMLDFTGITCVNCRAMETQVWSDPEVIKRMKNDFVIVSLYDDAREIPLIKEDVYISKTSKKEINTLGDKCLDIQISKYNSNSQPTYFFIDEKENKLADTGYTYKADVQKFIAHLEMVKANYKKTHP